jgi:hypothetical protein
MSDKIQLINDLFSKIAYYEEGSPHFQAHEFIENFNGVMSLFPAVRDKINEIREIDQILSRRTQEFNINRSDLRRLCVHLLTMFFKFSANAPSPYDRCYLSSRERRRPHKDAGFVTEILTPLIFSSGGLRDDFELKFYFLKRVNEFQRKFGGRRPVYDTISTEEAWKLPRPVLFADLVERYEQDPSRIHKEGMVENRLYRSGKFKLLAREDPFLEYLVLKLEYLVKVPWYKKIWAKITKGIRRILGTLHLGFIWYLLTKRRAAYLFYIFLILLILAGGVAVPLLWKSINQKKLEHLRRNTVQIMEKNSVSFLGEAGEME